MAQSFGDILKGVSRVGLDEVDVRHWVERYLFDLLGSEVRCPEVDGGKVVLVSKSSTIRQELRLVTGELKKAALVQADYKIGEVKVVRFSG